SQETADFIATSDKGAEVAYFLTQNPSEAARLASLHSYHQGIELARIESRLTAAPQVRKQTAAPPPPPKCRARRLHLPRTPPTCRRPNSRLGTGNGRRRRREAGLPIGACLK